MKKFAFLLICLCLALMPSIPRVFAIDDESQLDQSYIQNDQESVQVAFRGGGHYGGGHYGGYHYRHGYGHRPFGCWAVVPPPPPY